MTSYFTSAEAAKSLGVSRETLYQWMRMKRIHTPKARLGKNKQLLWTLRDIEEARKEQARERK